MKVKKRWITLMTAMTIIAIAGLAVGEPSFECDWSVISAADVAWLITATIFVLMMTPGLSFFYGGMVGAKNVISTMLQSFIAMGLISVLWVVIGFSLCFGDDIGGVIGNPLTFPMFHGVGGAVYTTPAGNVLGGATIPLALFALFQMKFAIITPSLITGSFAERVRFSAYMFFMMFFSSTLPVVSSSTHHQVSQLWPVPSSSDDGRLRHAKANQLISPLYFWVLQCCG